MKPRKAQTISVSWSRLGRRLTRDFNSRRLADQFVEELTSVARESAAFGSRITLEVRNEVVVNAVYSTSEGTARRGKASGGNARRG